MKKKEMKKMNDEEQMEIEAKIIAIEEEIEYLEAQKYNYLDELNRVKEERIKKIWLESCGTGNTMSLEDWLTMSLEDWLIKERRKKNE
jgi:hypothetical protein